MSKRRSSKISRAEIKQRLHSLDHNGLQVKDVSSQVIDHDLAARLQSLAVSSSMSERQLPMFLFRRVGVLVGRVRTVGWIAAAVLLAGFSLSAVNGLPDPLPVAVSNVLNVVGINVPHPENEPARLRQGNLDFSVTTTVAP